MLLHFGSLPVPLLHLLPEYYGYWGGIESNNDILIYLSFFLSILANILVQVYLWAMFQFADC